MNRIGCGSFVLLASLGFLPAGCESAADTPGGTSTPVGPTAPAGVETVVMCHHSDSSSSFAPILISRSEIAAHLAHGDGRPGQLVPGQDAKFGQDCSVLPLVPVTVTFNGLSVNGAPFVAIHEFGMTVSARSGNWEALTTYGHPAPSIIFRRLAGDPIAIAEIEITSSGVPFTFSAVDLYSSITTIPYVITGWLGTSVEFIVSGTVPNTFGRFATVASPGPPAWINLLTIRVSNPETPCCPNPAGLDTIVLKR